MNNIIKDKIISLLIKINSNKIYIIIGLTLMIMFSPFWAIKTLAETIIEEKELAEPVEDIKELEDKKLKDIKDLNESIKENNNNLKWYMIGFVVIITILGIYFFVYNTNNPEGPSPSVSNYTSSEWKRCPTMDTLGVETLDVRQGQGNFYKAGPPNTNLNWWQVKIKNDNIDHCLSVNEFYYENGTKEVSTNYYEIDDKGYQIISFYEGRNAQRIQEYQDIKNDILTGNLNDKTESERLKIFYRLYYLLRSVREKGVEEENENQ